MAASLRRQGNCAGVIPAVALLVGLTAVGGCAVEGDPTMGQPACADGLTAAGNVCRPADAALRVAVQSVQLGTLTLSGAGDRPLRMGHPVQATVDLHLQAAPLRASVALTAHAASRHASCVLGLLSVDTTGKPALQSSQTVHLSAPVVVPAGCAPLAGANDVQIVTTFDPQQQLYVPQRDDYPPGERAATADPTRVDQSATCGGKGRVRRATGCGTATIATSDGMDVMVRDAALTSAVAVVEYRGERPTPVADRPATVTRNADGSTATGVAVAAVDPDSLAPSLADAPLVSAAVALVQGGGSAGSSGPVAITLAVRPARRRRPVVARRPPRLGRWQRRATTVCRAAGHWQRRHR